MLEIKNLVVLEIYDILLTEYGFQVVLSSSAHTNRAIVIIVNFTDAHMLTMQYHKVRTPEPFSLDIVNNLLSLVELKPKYAIIYDVQDHRFATRLYFESRSMHHYMLETKISDALSVVMFSGVKLYISPVLFEKVSVNYTFQDEKYEDEAQQYRMSKIKELKVQLNLAITEERYEEAIFLRNEIKKLQGE